MGAQTNHSGTTHGEPVRTGSPARPQGWARARPAETLTHGVWGLFPGGSPGFGVWAGRGVTEFLSEAAADVVIAQRAGC